MVVTGLTSSPGAAGSSSPGPVGRAENWNFCPTAPSTLTPSFGSNRPSRRCSAAASAHSPAAPSGSSSPARSGRARNSNFCPTAPATFTPSDARNGSGLRSPIPSSSSSRVEEGRRSFPIERVIRTSIGPCDGFAMSVRGWATSLPRRLPWKTRARRVSGRTSRRARLA